MFLLFNLKLSFKKEIETIRSNYFLTHITISYSTLHKERLIFLLTCNKNELFIIRLVFKSKLEELLDFI